MTIPKNLGVLASKVSSTGAVPVTQVSDTANTSTGYLALPQGTTGQRSGSPVNGMIRYNSTNYSMEVYLRDSWVTLASNNPYTISTFGFKNRIINGAMVIDQRNAGAAITTTGAYVVDRWFFNNASDATLSVQQSTDVPSGSGFKYSLRMTATVGDATIGAAQYCNFQHRIEGYNFADTGFGASGASTVTLSFWVKATVVGNYSVALYNSAENRIYPQQFSVLVSNTWEQKTITIAGDTSGTWLTTNGTGLQVTFYPALGSNFLGSSGWNAGGTFGVTGQSNAIASNANIFAITGVQLETSNQATPFDFRDYGRELILCQRYYYQTISNATNATPTIYASSTNFTVGSIFPHPVTMRASPTITVFGTWATNGTAATAPNIDAPNIQGYLAYVNGNNGTIASTSFRPNSSGYLTVSAEL